MQVRSGILSAQRPGMARAMLKVRQRQFQSPMHSLLLDFSCSTFRNYAVQSAVSCTVRRRSCEGGNQVLRVHLYHQAPPYEDH